MNDTPYSKAYYELIDELKAIKIERAIKCNTIEDCVDLGALDAIADFILGKYRKDLI
jgi:hypothetical protein